MSYNKLAGPLWLIAFTFDALSIIYGYRTIDDRVFILKTFLDFVLVELIFGWLRSILAFIHKEIDFAKETITRRDRYDKFKGAVKGGEVGSSDFEDEAKMVIK